MTDDYTENTMVSPETPADDDLFRQDDSFNVPPPPPAALMSEKDNNMAPPPVAAAHTESPKVQMFTDGDQKRFAEWAGDTPPAAAHTAPKPVRVHLEPSAFSPDVKYGELLRYAREKAGYTVEQIAEKTKLRTYYLYAMEDDQPDRLPPPTYVSSYIRSLCIFYRLDDESVEFLRKRFNTETAYGDSSIPPALIETMGKDAQVSEAEDLRIKKMFRLFAVILVVVILLIAWAVYAILQADNKTEDATGGMVKSSAIARPEMTMDEFDSLTASQVPELSTLEMNKRPTVNRSNGR